MRQSFGALFEIELQQTESKSEEKNDTRRFSKSETSSTYLQAWLIASGVVVMQTPLTLGLKLTFPKCIMAAMTRNTSLATVGEIKSLIACLVAP